jgi:hypothetical protein
MSAPPQTGHDDVLGDDAREARCVVVRFTPRLGAPRYGAGYVVSPDVVLTSGQLVDSSEDGGEVHVRLWGDRRLRQCSVVWSPYDRNARAEERLDAALLRLADEDSRRTSAELPPVRWGRLVTRRPATPVWVGSGVSGMSGVIANGSAVKAGRLLVTLDESPSAEGRTTGAAVLCDGLLVAVIADAHYVSPQGHWLSAVPVDRLTAEPGFLEHVGEIEVEAAELQPILSPDQSPGPGPGDRPVRVDIADRLGSWCADPAWFSVRLLTGDDGAARIVARPLVTLLRARGWGVGFLDEGADRRALVVAGEVTTGLLLVVERAHLRGPQLSDLLDVLAHHQPGADSAQATATRVRLLLSAPAAGDWWEELRSEALLLRDLPAGTVLDLSAGTR